jgi:hypothetical protein
MEKVLMVIVVGLSNCRNFFTITNDSISIVLNSLNGMQAVQLMSAVLHAFYRV